MGQGSVIDHGREFDWGKTSSDYATHRPGPPQSFYHKLRALEVGLKDQRILDLGTGTGALALEFAANGAQVAGIDISRQQIAAAQRLAKQRELDVVFAVAPAEAIPFADHRFDVVTANQCWLYFDLRQTLPEVRRVLRPGGLLVTSHFSFLPRLDPIVQTSERLVLKHNPDWTHTDWDGRVPARPGWSREQCELRAMFYYDEAIPFTRESWRGRMRALRAIGATLSENEVRRFDQEHDELLKTIAPDSFTILHRIDAHIFEFRSVDANAGL